MRDEGSAATEGRQRRRLYERARKPQGAKTVTRAAAAAAAAKEEQGASGGRPG